MDDIYIIYHNEGGISFQWKKDIEKGNTETIQVVFGKIGLYLTVPEIKLFCNKIKLAKKIKKCNCNNMLLHTPLGKLDLVLSKQELLQIEDLIQGTLFKLNLDAYLCELNIN